MKLRLYCFDHSVVTEAVLSQFHVEIAQCFQHSHRFLTEAPVDFEVECSVLAQQFKSQLFEFFKQL